MIRNNKACIHRRRGEYKQALRHLKAALEFGAACSELELLGAAHLNLSAILSEMGRCAICSH